MLPEIHFTVGPASRDPAVLQALIDTGAPCCRINLSHTQPEELEALFAEVRDAAQRARRPIRIGVDLRGRKLRVGALPGGAVRLEPGHVFTLFPVAQDEEAMGEPERASVNCPNLTEIVRVDDRVLLDDGALELRVAGIDPDRVTCEVIVGGPLPERSGFNLPGRLLDLPPLTAKDRADLDAVSALAPDYVYLSYVDTADDIHAVRQALARRRLSIPVIAKIERAVAVENVAMIAEVADALCLARGDLGVELPLPRLPAAQRQVVAAARVAVTPVLLAGEVLLTTVQRPLPSRAELTDVTVALDQGCAGFVLSDETAVGCDPVAAVRWLQRIAAEMA
jgi:pyruvate kinase